MGKLRFGLGCAALVGWLSCGGGSSGLQDACEKSCERTATCAPEFGSVSACKQQCGKAEKLAAERCLTVAKLDACMAKQSCDDYLACSFESTGCSEEPGDGGLAATGGSSGHGGTAGKASTTGGQGGGIGGLGGTPDGPLSIDTFPRAFLAAFCTHIFNCCDRDVVQEFGSSPQECVAALRPGFSREFVEVQNSVDAARTRFNAKTAADCIDALAKSRCDSTASANWENVCDVVFVGLLPRGARCEDAIECIDGACATSASSNIRTCQTQPTLGERCVATCAQGFACDLLLSKCVAAGKTGAACDLDFDCASDFCDDFVCAAPATFCEVL